MTFKSKSVVEKPGKHLAVTGELDSARRDQEIVLDVGARGAS